MKRTNRLAARDMALAPKASKRPKWAKSLTAAEWLHLKDTSPGGRPTLRALKANLEHQALDGIPCYDCRHIGIKLGLLKREESQMPKKSS